MTDHSDEPTQPIGAAGGLARAESMKPEERKALAKKAAAARWAKAKASATPVQAVHAVPTADYKGVLELGGVEIPCYVLEGGRRVIGRTSFTEVLTGIK